MKFEFGVGPNVIKNESEWNCIIYWKVRACESGKSGLTTNFTRYKYWGM